MKKTGIKILLAINIFLISLMTNVASVAAATGSVSISASSSSVTVGQTVTVTVTTKCSGGSVTRLVINYNSGYLTLTSSPSDYNGNNGRLLIDTNGNSGSATFKFTTKAVGSTTVSVSVLEMYNMEGESVGTNSSASTTIRINQRSSGGGGGSSSGSSSKSSTPSLSSDASISSITVEGQTLSPKFASDITEYKIYLPKKTTSLNIEAKPSSSKAKVGTINGSVKDGWNTIPIVCTAEDGSKKTYNIQAYVEEEPDVFYQLGEEKLGVVKNLDNVNVFEGFEAADIDASSTEEGKEEKNKLTVFNWAVYNILYMENESGTKDFYSYDRYNNAVTGKFQLIELAGKRFVQTDFSFEEYPDLAETMEEAEFTLEDGTVTKCLKYKDTMLRDMRVFYVADERGQKHFYQYDTQENTLQRYFPVQNKVSDQSEEKKTNDYLEYAYMGIGAVSMLSLLVAMFAIRRSSNKRKRVS